MQGADNTCNAVGTASGDKNMAKQFGIAKNTAAAIQFLDSCKAVETYVELSNDWVEFAYNDEVEVSVVPDHIVWFDQGAAPEAALEALDAYHNV